ncbi:Eukaryotic translation initiation factor 4E-binding protein [Pseudolycoriella hygida]|uniref:Eukaryotic translation initiation factor 4E-binding protein n=1 Tax=Pseudolycoriella hygida TaxID=35572 RepID=A0A9Q0N9J2_9DIPT|nr:Eukaryotic translation initiation factor 4E-binding protein [Pseudolycoriella hygida]
MSASPIARQACSHAQAIPSKRVLVTDASQLPELYSSTPGGTLYSTTPGGTRIIYERAFLMNLKNSPLSRTPPSNIPSGLLRGSPNVPINTKRSPSRQAAKQKIDDPQEQFEIDL